MGHTNVRCQAVDIAVVTVTVSLEACGSPSLKISHKVSGGPFYMIKVMDAYLAKVTTRCGEDGITYTIISKCVPVIMIRKDSPA